MSHTRTYCRYQVEDRVPDPTVEAIVGSLGIPLGNPARFHSWRARIPTLALSEDSRSFPKIPDLSGCVHLRSRLWLSVAFRLIACGRRVSSFRTLHEPEDEDGRPVWRFWRTRNARSCICTTKRSRARLQRRRSSERSPYRCTRL